MGEAEVAASASLTVFKGTFSPRPPFLLPSHARPTGSVGGHFPPSRLLHIPLTYFSLAKFFHHSHLFAIATPFLILIPDGEYGMAAARSLLFNSLILVHIQDLGGIDVSQ